MALPNSPQNPDSIFSLSIRMGEILFAGEHGQQ
jgi:hypothetical protein